VVVIGGGPAGLCTALMLARRGYSNIKVRAKRAVHKSSAHVCSMF
jgi:2-polyprenyl-6-methoxyphenol hydroxylase-like FAD-dependent oxidoreductase